MLVPRYCLFSHVEGKEDRKYPRAMRFKGDRWGSCNHGSPWLRGYKTKQIIISKRNGRSKGPSIYPPTGHYLWCLYVASSASFAVVPIQHPRKLPHFTLSKQWTRQISPSTKSTGRSRQPAAGRKRWCMTMHVRSRRL